MLYEVVELDEGLQRKDKTVAILPLEVREPLLDRRVQKDQVKVIPLPSEKVRLTLAATVPHELHLLQRKYRGNHLSLLKLKQPDFADLHRSRVDRLVPF